MWELDLRWFIASTFKKAPRQPALRCWSNLTRLLHHLNEGPVLQSVQFRFCKSEGDAVYRVSGGDRAGECAMRLYVAMDPVRHRAYPLLFGTKGKSQSSDIARAKRLAASIRKG